MCGCRSLKVQGRCNGLSRRDLAGRELSASTHLTQANSRVQRLVAIFSASFKPFRNQNMSTERQSVCESEMELQDTRTRNEESDFGNHSGANSVLTDALPSISYPAVDTSWEAWRFVLSSFTIDTFVSALSVWHSFARAELLCAPRRHGDLSSHGEHGKHTTPLLAPSKQIAQYSSLRSVPLRLPWHMARCSSEFWRVGGGLISFNAAYGSV